MRIDVTKSDRRRRAKEKLKWDHWTKWFAWHPVKIDHKWVWLEWIQHKRHFWMCFDSCGTIHYYRFKE